MLLPYRSAPILSLLFVAVLTTPALAGKNRTKNKLPSYIHSEIVSNYYDGVYAPDGNDLLTAGLGRSGLAGVAPTIVDPLQPSAEELRRLAIYNNYRALVDISPAGGYGTLYGPNVRNDGTDSGLEGLIPGYEYLAFASTGHGRENVTLMVQIPETSGPDGFSPGFDPEQPCIVTATSSGSRGIYGAIGTAGDWGLKQGCAVAYTDKGTGNGLHDLATDTVNTLRGEREDADIAGKTSQFTAKLSDRKRERFLADHPGRVAYKHAHSGQNPEQHWGRDTLRAIEFAFWVLNEHFAETDKHGQTQKRFTAGNTLVIASSVSNGAGAALLAAEQDRRGLIDGIAVSEPNVNPEFDAGFAIQQGDGALFYAHSRSLIDYTTLLNLYQGCANAAQPAAPFNFTDLFFAAFMPSANRCASLRENGLLTADDYIGQALEAQAIINDYGFLPEQNPVQPSHWWASVPQAIAVTYSNAYSRAQVQDSLCGYGFAATDGNSLGTVVGTGEPVPLSAAAAAVIFSTGNGIPPTGGIEIINEDSANGPLLDRISVSPSTGRSDENFDGALCLRRLATGVDPVTGAALRGQERAAHKRLLASVRKLRADGNLRGRPAVIVTGRSDAILPLNHASRAYYGLNQRVEGNRSGLHYYEVTNAQHLDAFNAFAGFDTRYVPLHHYYIQALNSLWAHLTLDQPLPPSQVVHTLPRGGDAGAAPAITLANLPPIQDAGSVDPAALIDFDGAVLHIPE